MYNETPEKSKKISWLSIFSSLCNSKVEEPIDDLAKKASELNDNLHKKYPEPEPNPETPFPSKGDMPCPICKRQMIRQTNKTNAKAPDWKCSDSNCRFALNRTTKKYEPSKFITSVWD